MPTDPATPRPASTVVLARDAPDGVEVLLLRRPPTGFAADAWVFPGGTVDSEDYRLEPATSEQTTMWASRLGLADPALAWSFVVAAIRETWEETGVLLGADHAAREALGAVRPRVLAGDDSFTASAVRVGYRPDGRVLHYVARWITPQSLPRRYDTRFFLAAVDADTPVSLHGQELREAAWIRPEAALAARAEGKLHLMTPTAHTLKRLAGSTSAAQMLDRSDSLPPTIYPPTMRVDPEGIIIGSDPLKP